MESLKLFLVEDDAAYGEMLKHFITLNPEFEVEFFKTGQELLDNLHRNPDIISLDYSLPDISGLKLLKKIREFNSELPVIMVSGQEDIGTAISLLKEGAYDYILKDSETKEHLWNVLSHLKENLELRKEIRDLKEEIGKRYDYENVIKGKSPVINQVFNLLEKAARSNISVILTGESGTGKDLVAKAIHYNSARKKKSYVTVNVSAIPKELIDLELFGHEKNYLAGSNTRKAGKIELANKGTLFIDEVTSLNLNTQLKLLSVLQNKEFTRLGGNEAVKIDNRLIVSTNHNLREEVQKGNFREDLYYRMLGLPIELPPLRYRGNDILILAKHFIDEFCKENNTKTLSISPGAQEKLLKYSYPGNVRELKSIVELGCVLANSDVIDDIDISFNSSIPRNDFLLEENTLEEYTRRIIRFYLQKYNNNVLLVAEKLDIGKSTIYRMLKNKEI